jgi:hypothetical protein
VSGERKNTPAFRQEIIVLMAGPLPGTVLGAFLCSSPNHWVHRAGLLSILINLANLLPFEPLDGGRIMRRLLYLRHRWIDGASVTLSVFLFFWFVCGRGVLGAVMGLGYGFLTFGFFLRRVELGRTAEAFRARFGKAAPPMEDMTMEQRVFFFETAQGCRPDKTFVGHKETLEKQVEAYHEHAALDLPSWPESVGWAGLVCLLALIGWVLGGVKTLRKGTILKIPG